MVKITLCPNGTQAKFQGKTQSNLNGLPPSNPSTKSKSLHEKSMAQPYQITIIIVYPTFFIYQTSYLIFHDDLLSNFE
jgi:hypothetical protein